MSDFPRKIWLRNSSGYISERTLWAETSRSWICGPYRCNTKKLPKKSHSLATEQEAAEHQWASAHRYRIAQQLEWASPAMLRQIAAMIGYEDEEARHA